MARVTRPGDGQPVDAVRMPASGSTRRPRTLLWSDYELRLVEAAANQEGITWAALVRRGAVRAAEEVMAAKPVAEGNGQPSATTGTAGR